MNATWNIQFGTADIAGLASDLHSARGRWLVAFCCSGRSDSVTLRRDTEPPILMNEGQLRRRIFLRMLGHPLVVAPFVLGLTAATAVWVFNWPTALGLFCMAAGALGSAGVYLTRLVLDGGKTAAAVLADGEQADRQAAEAALDLLERRLTKADNDPRPETALRDLRALVRAMDDYAKSADELRSPAVIDVRSRVQQIFDSSVRSLEQTLQLGDTAKILQLPEARQPLLEQRERIIADIQDGVRQLGTTLAALQQLGTGAQSTRELSRLRDELDQSLAIASRVEERLSTFLDENTQNIRLEPPRINLVNNQKGN
nr:hypothetical protein [uncultured bacterium]